MDGSKDAELLIRNLSDIVIRDQRLPGDQIDEQQINDPVEINESMIKVGDASKVSDPRDRFFDAEYVLNDGTEVEDKVQVDDRNSDSELKDDDLKEDDGSKEDNS